MADMVARSEVGDEASGEAALMTRWRGAGEIAGNPASLTGRHQIAPFEK